MPGSLILFLHYSFLFADTHAHTQTPHIHMNIHTMHIYTHTHIYICIHIYTHTCTHILYILTSTAILNMTDFGGCGNYQIFFVYTSSYQMNELERLIYGPVHGE